MCCMRSLVGVIGRTSDRTNEIVSTLTQLTATIRLRMVSQVRRFECDEKRNTSSYIIEDGLFDGLDVFNHCYRCIVDVYTVMRC